MQKCFTQESTSFGCWSVPKYPTSSDTSLSLRQAVSERADLPVNGENAVVVDEKNAVAIDEQASGRFYSSIGAMRLAKLSKSIRCFAPTAAAK